VGRKVFWQNVVIFSVWTFIGGGLTVGVIQAALPDKDMQTSAYNLWLAAALVPLVIAPVAVCAVATGLRRLHDRDRSGAWLLALYGIPVAGVGLFNMPMVSDLARGLVLFVVIFPGALWACIALGIQRGTIGPNRFGADPVAYPAKPNKQSAASP
jgi:uncharacterized membrane protein YhaH (DUF805 family)